MQDPTTAIALRYEPTDGSDAPRIVATGQGYMAEEIVRVARENNVPLHQDPTLAGTLATLDVGAQIPQELFRSVAEVLAFVYKMNGKA